MAAKLAGGGKAKYDLGQNADINVTPFVDVMLVLLIIFMVAAPMATVAIKIDLPPASGPTRSPTPAEWGTGAAFVVVSLLVVVAMIGVPIWLVRSAWKIIKDQPKSEP